MDSQKIIDSNILAHDKVSDKYDLIHGEIFSEIEQRRLADMITLAKNEITTDSLIKRALDFGCGSGNLVKHLLNMGFDVIASDVSTKFLDLVSNKFKDSGNKLRTLHLNGRDLSELESNSFDFVGTYSVLHHVPDYLLIVREMCRVLKKGGVLYIDHEVNQNYWLKEKSYLEFLSKIRFGFICHNWRNYFNFSVLISVIIRIFNPKYQPEGDIHVFEDDHIEWIEIEKIISDNGCKILSRHDYLLFKEGYDKNMYNHYKRRCTDYRCLIVRKIKK